MCGMQAVTLVKSRPPSPWQSAAASSLWVRVWYLLLEARCSQSSPKVFQHRYSPLILASIVDVTEAKMGSGVWIITNNMYETIITMMQRIKCLLPPRALPLARKDNMSFQSVHIRIAPSSGHQNFSSSLGRTKKQTSRSKPNLNTPSTCVMSITNVSIPAMWSAASALAGKAIFGEKT
jgi:hypothetical protein